MQRETRKQYIPVVSGIPETAGFCLWGASILPAPVILNDSEGSPLFVMPANAGIQCLCFFMFTGWLVVHLQIAFRFTSE
jgi:hypothetical protein